METSNPNNILPDIKLRYFPIKNEYVYAQIST